MGLALGLGLAVPWTAFSQGEFNLTNSSYVQDFDSLGTGGVVAVPPGFKMTPNFPSNTTTVSIISWTNAANVMTTAYAANSGTPTNTGRYNWGDTGGTDRALGIMSDLKTLGGGSAILAGFTNNTGNTITQIVAGFTWEQYRITNVVATNLCYFSLDGTKPSWTLQSSNIFAGGSHAYGYPLSTAAVSVTKGGLSISNGGKFYFLFQFSQPTAVKYLGWALDDLALTLEFAGNTNPPPDTNCTPGAVEFVQDPGNYAAWFTAGNDLFPNPPDELGMAAPSDGDRIVAWREFRTDGNGEGGVRALQPGDRFRITLSGDSSYGMLGISLNDGAATTSWGDRTNSTRGLISSGHISNPAYNPDYASEEYDPRLNLPGDLTATSQAGESSWPGINSMDRNVTAEFFILSSKEFTAHIVGQTNKCDLAMIGAPGDADRIDGFSIYCENNVDRVESNAAYAAVNAYWKPETSVTNLGYVEFGADGGTRTIAGQITDGSSPACTNSPSPNRLVKSGEGSVTLAHTNNTYTLDTEIAGGTLQIAADTCLGAAPASVSNAHIKLAGGATLAGTESFALNAHRGIALSSGTSAWSVAEAKTMTYAGVIGGPGSLTKTGTGTLVLSGMNTFDGATAVGAGTLQMSGSATNSSVTVWPGAVLMGAGSVSNLAVFGLVGPGNSVGARATLSCGSLALAAGGTLRVDVSNAEGTPGTDWDMISASGAINVHTSGIFTIQLHGAPAGFSAAQGFGWKIMAGASVVDFSASRFAVNTDNFLSATDGGTFSVGQSGTDIVLDYAPRTPTAPAFSVTPTGVSAVTLTFSATDPVVIVANGTGGFATPTGTAPAAGNAFAGGAVVCNGSSSPQTHSGGSSCTRYYYSAWAYNGTNYSPAATTDATTDIPAAPTGLHASSTNVTDFVASWVAPAGASGYRLDVSANVDFQNGFVSGYSNRAVAGTDQGVAGLSGAMTYYFRVRAEGDGGCASANSATASVTLAAASVTNDFESWLQKEQGLDPEDSRYAPDADDDLDGMTTWEEFLADTDPARSGSVLRVTGTFSSVSHQMQLEFPASSNRYYQLVYSTNLMHGNTQSNLGWGIPGMVVTSDSAGPWFGGIRSLLTNPPPP